LDGGEGVHSGAVEMIARPLACLLCLGFALNAAAEAGGVSEPLRFNGIADHYASRAEITFTVTSTSGRSLWFYCIAESQSEGKWREIDYSIDPRSRSSKSVALLPLVAGGAKKLSWKPFLWKVGPSAVVRLKAEVFEKPGGEPVRSVISRWFAIN
jgi:hypothetical protein